MENKKYFCSFADKKLWRSLNRISQQAIEMKCYDGIFSYNEDDLSDDFRQEFKDKLKPSRGFGYWVWKPQIILQSLEKMNDGDILHYSDAGSHLNKNGRKRLLEYFELTNISPLGILAFGGGEADDENLIKSLTLKEKHWTKGDLFDYFKMRNNAAIYNSEQISAGHLFLKKSKDSIDFIRKWLKVYQENFSLVDDTPSVSNNFKGFVENRHDQSVFSILCKMNSINHVSAGEHWQMFEMQERLKDYPIWSMRDLDKGLYPKLLSLFTKSVKYLSN